MFVPLLSNNHREIHVNHHQTPLATMNHYDLLLNNNIYIYIHINLRQIGHSFRSNSSTTQHAAASVAEAASVAGAA